MSCFLKYRDSTKKERSCQSDVYFGKLCGRLALSYLLIAKVKKRDKKNIILRSIYLKISRNSQSIF